MFSKKAPVSNATLDSIIENMENALVVADEESDTYTKMVDNLEKLYKMKRGDTPASLELKDWLPIIGSVSGILIIVLFEAFGHTITSKSLGFASKLKS